MFAAIIFKLVLITFVWLVLYTLVRIIKIRFLHAKFKKNANGLATLPLPWFHPGGNLHEVYFRAFALNRADALHKKYGKTFGLFVCDQPTVFSIDRNLIKLIIGPEATKHTRRGNLSVPIVEFGTKGLWFNQTDQWRAMRRPFTPALAKHNLHSQNVIVEIDSVVGRLIGCIEEHLKASPTEGSAVVNVSDVMARYSVDLIYTCFYKQPNIVDYRLDRKDTHVATIERGLGHSMTLSMEVAVSLPLLIPILQALFDQFHEVGAMKRKIISFIKQQVVLSLEARREITKAERRGLPVDEENVILSDGKVYKRNLIDPFIDSYHSGKLSQKDFLASTFFIYLASIVPVVDGISQMLYYLAINVTVQDKLRASILKNGLESEYLNWCMNEVFRLAPPNPSGCSRILERDVEVEGGVVPKGTFVITLANILHRLPEYWGDDANQFIPERWADADKFPLGQFIPFGGGSRVCPGRELTLIEMRKVTEALLTRYKIERCAKTSDSGLFDSPLLATRVPETPVYLKFSPLLTSQSTT